MTSAISEHWDQYVGRFPEILGKLRSEGKGEHVVWPGDEWGRPERWVALFAKMFIEHLPPNVSTAIEIGPGAGKYTHMFLGHYTQSRVLALDVSPSYLAVLQERSSFYLSEKRLMTDLLTSDYTTVSDTAANHGIKPGGLDVLFSIDAIVHVDLVYVTAYWMSAQKLLRPGGKMIMTVADPTTELGFKTLIANVHAYFSTQGRPSSRFEFMSPDIVRSVLDRLGFDVEEAAPHLPRRDYCFVATKRS